MAQPAGEPPRTCLFLYAESPSVALYSREHGSPYRQEPWMSDEAWENHYAGVRENHPKLLDLLDTLRPDIFYLASNGQFQLFGMDKPSTPTLAQVQAQLDAQREELAQYRGRGGDDVGFYRCAISIRGNPEERHGIFALYDRWDEYAEVFGLGPKPPVDPLEWRQIRFDSGRPYIRAWDKPDAGGNIGYFCCPNNPYWRQLTAAMVRTGAEVGYTHLFVDNPSMFCKCDWCREAFKEHQRRRFTEGQWEALFPGIPYGEGDIEDERLSVERERFWQDSIGRHLAAMKQAMQEGNPGAPITLSANGSQMTLGPWYTSRVNLAQFSAAGVNLGFKESPFEFSGANLRPVGNGLLAVEPGDIYDGYRLVRGARGDDYYACPAQSYANIAAHDNLYRLAMSEALAMDGCFLDGVAVTAPITSREAMYDYLNGHRELFRAGTSIARVAVIIGASEFYFGDDFHADATRDGKAIRDWLSDQQIPFDYLIDGAATVETLAPYELVVVPGFRSLDDAAADALREFVGGGGSLILSGPVGTHHPSGPARPAPVLADLLADATPADGLLVAEVGEGRVVACPRRFADADLPEGFSTTDYKVARPQTIGGKTRGPMLPVCVEANRELFLAALDLAVGSDLSLVQSADMPGLRVAGRYRTDAETPWLAVHVVNEQMLMRFSDTGGGFVLSVDGEPREYRDVRLIARLPDGFHATRVRWAQVPMAEPRELEFEALADGIACTLPAVELYSLVFVELGPGRSEGRTVAEVCGERQEPHAGQGLYVVDASASPPAPPAEPADAPQAIPMRLNFTHPALIYARAGDRVRVQIAAYGPEGKWARWWVVAPSGELLSTGAVACGQSAEVAFEAEAEGAYLVQAQAGAHDVSIASPTHGVCFPATPAQRLNLTGQPPELYFRVPPGAEAVPLLLQTRDRDGVYEILDAQGNVIARRDGLGQATVMDAGGAMVWSDKSAGAVYQRVAVPVPEGQAGAIWRLRFQASRPDSSFASNLYFDEGFGGMVSTSPAGLPAVRP